MSRQADDLPESGRGRTALYGSLTCHSCSAPFSVCNVPSCLGLSDACPRAQVRELPTMPGGQASDKPQGRKPRNAPRETEPATGYGDLTYGTRAEGPMLPV